MISCISIIPTFLLSMFVIETADVPRWRTPICAQVRAESGWKCDDAVNMECEITSGAGASGLGQFMPPTWAEIAPAVGCAGESPTDARCSIKAVVEYMRQLLAHRYCRASDEPWPVAQACYNAGMGWIDGERERCRMTHGCDVDRWFDHRENVCSRSSRACRETKDYVRRIRRFSGG